MSRTIAVFGAGSGLGTAVARRFGADGYRVALIARREGPLADLAARLTAEGVEAAALPADLGRPEDIPALVNRIRERFGRIDVVTYAPYDGRAFTPAADLTPDALRPLTDVMVHGLVQVVHEVLPEMIDRGDGVILAAGGGSALTGLPHMSGMGPAMAGARNYLQSLHAEVAGKGVYVGALYVTAVIENSAAHQTTFNHPEFRHLPVVSPGELADALAEMSVKRDPFERVLPGMPV